MRKVTVKFKDSEFGDEMITFLITKETGYEPYEALEFAMRILYLDFEYSTLEELQENNKDLTQHIYDICMDILDGGWNGVITSRFCDFMERVFGWEREPVGKIYTIDVEHGNWFNFN